MARQLNQKETEQKKEKNNKVFHTFVERFGLEKYSGKSSRHTCPQCGHRNTFALYIDKVTGQKVGDQFGRCNREISCGYHLAPKISDLPKDAQLYVSNNEVKPEYQEKDSVNYINSKYVTKSLEEPLNSFTYFLYNHFQRDLVDMMIRRYRLGTVEKWNDRAVVFWQLDEDFDCRTGKIMLYDRNTGKRVKKPYNHITWVHCPTKDKEYGEISDFNLKQVFFGEHLVHTAGIEEFHVVESEKTAVICSIMKPNTYWIATGGLQNIGEDRLRPFIDKKLIFYPDKGNSSKTWKNKLKPFMDDYNIVISDFLEKQEDIEEGEDMADYIIKRLEVKQ
jgi:hypothetical protein|nr:MAG TPA: DNA primase/helicase [Caudoviricetes sp.]